MPSVLLARITSLLFAIALMGAAPAIAAPNADDARGFVEQVSQEVLDTLEDPNIAREVKAAELADKLEEVADMPLVARLVLGRYWRQISREQQNEYVELFREFATASLASQFDSFNAASYEITGAQVVDDRDVVVTTRVADAASPEVYTVEWRLRETDGTYKLIDVIGEGISLVITQRDEFASVINRQGFDGLLDLLRERVAELDAA